MLSVEALGNWCFNLLQTHLICWVKSVGFAVYQLFQNFFEKFSVFDDLKIEVILPLFKGKGAKANNKDNYRGINTVPHSL